MFTVFVGFVHVFCMTMCGVNVYLCASHSKPGFAVLHAVFLMVVGALGTARLMDRYTRKGR